MKKLLAIFGLCLPFFVNAQNSGYSLEAVGQVSPVIKEDVKKINDPAKQKDTTLPAPQFTYTLQTKRYTTTVKIDTIKAAKLGAEPVQKLYRTYARLGVGNYSTLLGEVYFGSLRSKTGAYGAHVSYFGSGNGPKDVPGEASGFNQENASVFGTRFLKHHTLYGGFDYDRNVVYNYGSAADTAFFQKGAIRNHYSYYGVNGRLESHLTDSASINHDIGVRYYHFNDRYKNNEDNVLLDVNASRFIHTALLSLAAGVDYNRAAGTSDTAGSTILHFQPMLSASGSKFQVAIGIGINVDAGDQTYTYFNEQLHFSYDVYNHFLIPYIDLTGGIQRNSFHSLTQENPFLFADEIFRLRNTVHKNEFSAGLRGTLGPELAYDAHFTHVQLLNQPFFVNTTFAQDLFQNKFAIVYDTAEVTSVHGQLAWQHFEKTRLLITGDWYHYSMAKEAHPWHTPTLRLSLTGEYNIQDLLIGRVQIYYLNGQYAKIANGTTFTSVTLKGVVDANLGFEYRYSKFLSLFLNVNNIAAQRYQRWYGYPTQKFNVLGGVTYTF